MRDRNITPFGGPDDDVEVVGGVVMLLSMMTIGHDGPLVSASVE